MIHPTHDQLRGYLEESLELEQNNVTDEHVSSCLACQEILEKLTNELLSLSRWADQNSHDSQQPTEFKNPLANDREIAKRFILLGEIARGGMGVVYRGFDRELKREVAIKIAQRTDNDSAAIRFYREAQLSAQLEHPGIVPVHQTGWLSDGRQYIAMRLVHGRDFLSLIQESSGKGSSFQLLKIFGDVCDTMAYAHAKGIVHRDLKPGNIMIGEFGEVQIMDWGLAKRLKRAPKKSAHMGHHAENQPQDSTDDPGKTSLQQASIPETGAPGETVLGQAMGTPAYMPPEQAQGKSVDRRADVFALGGILFHILTGKAPFEAPTNSLAQKPSADSEIETAIHELDNSGSDPELIEIVKRCLAPDTRDRPCDAASVNQLFHACLAGRRQEWNAMKLSEPDPGSADSSWLLFVLGGVILVLVMVIIGLLAM